MSIQSRTSGWQSSRCSELQDRRSQRSPRGRDRPQTSAAAERPPSDILTGHRFSNVTYTDNQSVGIYQYNCFDKSKDWLTGCCWKYDSKSQIYNILVYNLFHQAPNICCILTDQQLTPAVTAPAEENAYSQRCSFTLRNHLMKWTDATFSLSDHLVWQLWEKVIKASSYLLASDYKWSNIQSIISYVNFLTLLAQVWPRDHLCVWQLHNWCVKINKYSVI